MSNKDFEIFDVPLSRMKTIAEGDGRRYPLDMLAVGQGFAITNDCNRQSLNSCKSAYGKKTGKRFIIRKLDGQPCCIRVA